MLFKRFRFQVVFRIIVLTLSIYAMIYLLVRTRFYTTAVVLAVVILYQVYALVRYVEKTNRYLGRFFLAVKHGDVSTTLSGKELGPSFAELISLFNEVMEKIDLTRLEKEEQYRYLQTIVQHIGIGLLSFTGDGSVDLINTAAKKLFKVARLKNINSLAGVNLPLKDILLSLKHGEKSLVKIDERDMELAVHASEFRLKDRKFTLVSIQDIQSELQEKEMEAWQTLIRVLTHEIMNSMTPIASMTATVIGLLEPLYDNKTEQETQKEIDPETAADILDALKTIHKRSTGLTHFVSAYRNLTLIPKPQFKIFPLEDLFFRVEKLMENKFMETGVRFQRRVDPQTLELTADPGLIEQVLINLLLNAVDALQDCKNAEPQIDLTAELDDTGSFIVQVTDNGPGIAEEALKKVFIPFFTTKKKGSGIGLSLSRQIMKLHRGTIRIQSEPDVKTVCTLRF
jgi:nitrogen fixation/metabolism regulation signal transduction histidine kinase